MFIIKGRRINIHVIAVIRLILPLHSPKKRLWKNHKSLLFSLGLSTKDDDCDLPSTYWIPKLHKNPYK